MSEFEELINRTHDAGLKVIIDFVPNHVSRDYGKVNPSPGHPVLGAEDDRTTHWKPENDFFYYVGHALICLPLFRTEWSHIMNFLQWRQETTAIHLRPA